MQTTLEVRWFLEGIFPATVERWFRFECPGQLLTLEAETRKDLYACGNLENYLNEFKEALDFAGDWAQPTLYAERYPQGIGYPLGRDRINLKLREGNLELKLREEFGIQTFTARGDRIWSGRVEQWRKFNLQQENTVFDRYDGDISWIPVYKKRLQKRNRGVESELTQLETKNSAWWTIAFEMPTDNNLGANFFCEVVKAALTYSELKLLAENSYGYADWLNKFVTNPKD